METSSKPKRKPTTQQILVEKFVSEENRAARTFWPREIKLANKLVAAYNLDFLLWVIPPYNKKVPSLAYFIADYGKKYLAEQFFNFKLKNVDLSGKAESFSLSDTKIGEDAVLKKEPKTLKDFLKLYQ